MKQQFPSAHPSSACAVDPHESHPPFLPLARVTFCYPRNLPYCQRPPRLDVAFSGVSTGHLTLFFDSTRLCGKSRPQKADSIIHCQTQAAATARYFAFFPCLLFFLRRAAISPRKKEARADEGRKGTRERERVREDISKPNAGNTESKSVLWPPSFQGLRSSGFLRRNYLVRVDCSSAFETLQCFRHSCTKTSGFMAASVNQPTLRDPIAD